MDRLKDEESKRKEVEEELDKLMKKTEDNSSELFFKLKNAGYQGILEENSSLEKGERMGETAEGAGGPGGGEYDRNIQRETAEADTEYTNAVLKTQVRRQSGTWMDKSRAR